MKKEKIYKKKAHDYYAKNADVVKERNLSKYRNDEVYRLRCSAQRKERYQREKLEKKFCPSPYDYLTHKDPTKPHLGIQSIIEHHDALRSRKS